ncbi:MAG TPA: hypothetical protein P5120_03640 [Spirochaetota bacterium]|nr:hypothetical protein [Spirochaetota bacterium]HPF05075.1 hypothetical protein [Spirochaetota bacterium]HPJ41480.1 hypothetical protein [Spirochaetota bacterium]HPR38846.1 hypothetical protein [Spirochaetota bacterium]HRX46588.1 hypothetical protein [Spirochaetota bacterium]
MKNITVTLHTGEHCIETSAKIEFRRLTDLLLQSDTDNIDSDIEEKIELLLNFLENSDFNILRASDERLAGITPSDCIIKWDKNNTAVVKLPD